MAADFSTLISGIDIASVGATILAAAGVMAGVHVIVRGVYMVLDFVDPEPDDSESGFVDHIGHPDEPRDEANPYEGGYWENGLAYDEQGKREPEVDDSRYGG